MNKELIDALEKAVAELKKNAAPSDQHLLDDGYIRHTGDVCPVHSEDEGIARLRDGVVGSLRPITNWGKSKNSSREVTHYKVTKAYDPHAENKLLYAKDAKEHKEPWKLWEMDCSPYGEGWSTLVNPPTWLEGLLYRRKQTKKLVDWSCHLLKGANTNYGEYLKFNLASSSLNSIATLYNNMFYSTHLNDIRLLPPANAKSNWQAYNGEDLNLLHEAGFVVEVKYWNTSMEKYCNELLKNMLPMADSLLKDYRVIAIRDGFTANPEEGV